MTAARRRRAVEGDCTLAPGATSASVAIVLTNNSGAAATVAGFTVNVATDQGRLSPTSPACSPPRLGRAATPRPAGIVLPATGNGGGRAGAAAGALALLAGAAGLGGATIAVRARRG